jgi:catechol 2,3-dioxygenase-like lactoylglutathione lyase family enzyme
MMFQTLDHIIIAVADLDEATSDYRSLLGRSPSWRGSHPQHGTRNTLFRLENTYVELLATNAAVESLGGQSVREALAPDRRERPFGLALGVEDIKAAVNFVRGRGLRASEPIEGVGVDERSGRRRTWRSAWIEPATAAGLRLLLIQHTSPPTLLPRGLAVADVTSFCLGVDHVVVVTRDLPASLRLWTEAFRLPERWRLDFPERGTSNVGLALGGITLELILRTDRSSGGAPDRFWGVAYEVAECDQAVVRLREAGITVDDPRPGLARASRVATVKWQRTPSLLIERQAEPPPPGLLS